MSNGGFLTDTPDVSAGPSFRFPLKLIRFYPVEIRETEDSSISSSNIRYCMYGSTNINEKVAITPYIPFSLSCNFIHRRKYTFLGCCSLEPRSQKGFSLLNIPAAANCHMESSKCKEGHQSKRDDSFKWRKTQWEKICCTVCNWITTKYNSTSVTCSNPNARFNGILSKMDHNDNCKCNDYGDTDFNSADLVVGLEISSGVDELHASIGTLQDCHNNPKYVKDRSVMITLKFNDIRAVIQAHGHLDGCSQFVKVDLGIGDRAGVANRKGSSTAAVAAGSGKRFSCVLTSTFPCKPTHPNQCVAFGRLCSITELEKAVQEYYYSSSCQQGIVEKSDKETGKLKFLQGHIFVSICSGNYNLEVATMRQCARLQAAADDMSLFDQRLQDAKTSVRAGDEDVIFIGASTKEVFFCDFAVIKSKSSFLAELVEMREQTLSSGLSESRVLHMNELESETVSALISYLKDSPLKGYGITMISCCTAISLIEVGRKYKIHNLEKYICQLIIKEKEPLWFDIKSLVKLFHLCHLEDLADGEKVKYKVIQTFRMKHRDEDKEGCVQRLFREDPDVAAELLMEALTIC